MQSLCWWLPTSRWTHLKLLYARMTTCSSSKMATTRLLTNDQATETILVHWDHKGKLLRYFQSHTKPLIVGGCFLCLHNNKIKWSCSSLTVLKAPLNYVILRFRILVFLMIKEMYSLWRYGTDSIFLYYIQWYQIILK